MNCPYEFMRKTKVLTKRGVCDTPILLPAFFIKHRQMQLKHWQIEKLQQFTLVIRANSIFLNFP